MHYYLLCELQQRREESFESHFDFYLSLYGFKGIGFWRSSLDESCLGDAVLGGSVTQSNAVPVLVVVGPAETHFVGLDQLSLEHLALLPRLVQQHLDVVNNLIILFSEFFLTLALPFSHDVRLKMVHDCIL